MYSWTSGRSAGGRGTRLRIVAALVVPIALGLFSAAPASAHSQLTSTSPIDGAVLDEPPTEVRFTFDAPLLDDTDTISINDHDGNVVSSIHPKPQGDSVAIPWPVGTPAGTYQVAYRVVCGDGHPVVGAINLTLSAAAAGPTSAASTSTASAPSAATPAAGDAAPPASGSPLVVVAGAVVLGAAVIAVAAVLITRRRTTPTHT